MTKPKYVTTSQLAKHFRCSRSRIQTIAAERGLKPAIIAANTYLWDSRDIPLFVPRLSGTPGHRKNTEEPANARS